MTFTEFEKLRNEKWIIISKLAKEIPNSNFLSIAERNAKRIIDILSEINEAKKTLQKMEV